MFGRKKVAKNLRPMIEIVQSDAVHNAANTLLANIEFSSIDQAIQVIAITSSIPNEGKSTVSLSLAAAAGKADKKVLIMEGDLRRRSLRAALNAHPQHGLHAVLKGTCTLAEAVYETKLENVDFLDAEPGIPSPEALLNSKKYTELIELARTVYDLIIIDTPPVSAFADAAIIASQADGSLLVVRQNFTDKRVAQLAMSQLRASTTQVLGVVMNFEEHTGGSGYYGYYYGYYYDEKKVPADSPEAQMALENAKASKSD